MSSFTSQLEEVLDVLPSRVDADFPDERVDGKYEWDASLDRTLEEAAKIRLAREDWYIDIHALVLGMYRTEGSVAGRLFQAAGANPGRVEEEIACRRDRAGGCCDHPDGFYERFPLIRSLGENLSLRISSKKPFGREKELNHFERWASNRSGRSLVVLGESGVGKTFIVESLATRLQLSEDDHLTIVIEVEPSVFLYGTDYASQWLEQGNQTMEEARKAKSAGMNVIWFWDERHTLLEREANIKAFAEKLKAQVQHGTIRILGAIAPTQYVHSIARKAALDRLFDKYTIAEPDPEIAVVMMGDSFGKLRNEIGNAGLRFEFGCAEKAVELARQHIKSYATPASSLDVLRPVMQISIRKSSLADKAGQAALHDKAWAKERIIAALERERGWTRDPEVVSKRIKEASTERDQLRVRIAALCSNEPFQQNLDELRLIEEAYRNLGEAIAVASGPERNDLYRAQMNVLEPQMRELKRATLCIATPDDVIRGVEEMTGIRLTPPTDEEMRPVLKLAESLGAVIYGQPQVLTPLSRSICGRMLEIGRSQPVYKALLTGPSGTGKTVLANALASSVYSPDGQTKYIDRGTVSDVSAVTRLFGDRERQGDPTSFVKMYPRSVIVFDGIEEATPALRDQLLDILENGHTMDYSSGQHVVFASTIILFLSNLGQEALLEYDTPRRQRPADRIHDRVMGEIESRFRPEFLKRLDDDVLMFRPLTAVAKEVVVESALRRQRELFVTGRGVSLIWDEDLPEYLTAQARMSGANTMNAWSLSSWIRSEFSRALKLAFREGLVTPGAQLIVSQNLNMNINTEQGQLCLCFELVEDELAEE